jgi:hypothetical protein
MIGLALGEELMGDLGVARCAGELVDLRLLPIELEPPEAVEDFLDRVGGRAGAIGVLDAEVEGAAVMARLEPVEQRRAGAADVEIAGGRGGEANDWFHKRRLGKALFESGTSVDTES